MNVFVENGSYHMQNMGDVAMLQVALNRITRCLPDASLTVITGNPSRLHRLCPAARSVSAECKDIWLEKRFGLFVQRLLPRRFQWILNSCEDPHFPAFPYLANVWKEMVVRFNHKDSRCISQFYSSMRDADAVICSGGGLINDLFVPHSMSVLATLRLAQRMGKPTAMFGLGLGPLEKHPGLRARTTEVLANLHALGLRESRSSIPLLRDIGIPIDQVATVVTGDDAIEIAYSSRQRLSQTGIGINVRMAPTSQLTAELLSSAVRTLRTVCRRWNTKLIAAPVLLREPNGDLTSMQGLLDGLDVDYESARQVISPLDLIDLIGHCRIMISTSYHSAVFALAQGIPVVGLVYTQYYKNKLYGLKEQFGPGCTILSVDEADFGARFADVVEQAWFASTRTRDSLTAAAQNQIAIGQRFYADFFHRLEEARPSSGSHGHNRPRLTQN